MNKTDWQKLEERIQQLCDLEEGLNSWEVNFVDDISKQEVKSLTPRQIETVNKVFEKRIK